MLKEKILVIDEVQKCFNWAEVIKALYDESYENLTAIVVSGLQEVFRSVFKVGSESDKTRRRIEKLEGQLLQVLKMEMELEKESAALETAAQERTCAR